MWGNGGVSKGWVRIHEDEDEDLIKLILLIFTTNNNIDK